MPLNEPSLDNRNYADILRDALARIPVHNPEWTNFNDSDPGVTLIQLFAFMTESILYRANQIPNRNRLKFLQLLGISLRPASSAQGLITITNARGHLSSEVLPDHIDVRAGQVRFQTIYGLEVLPVEAGIFYKQKLSTGNTAMDTQRAQLYAQLYADLLEDGQTGAKTVPAFYETTPMPQPTADGELPIIDLANTVDGCLWIALLARPSEDISKVRAVLANKTLTVGVMPYMEEEGIVVREGATRREDAGDQALTSNDSTPANQGTTSQTNTRVSAQWEIAHILSNQSANYRSLPHRLLKDPSQPDLPQTGSPLTAPSLVELTLPETSELAIWDWDAMEPGLEGTGEYPPAMTDTNLRDRIVTWLRLRVENPANVKLSWLGINATMVRQRVPVTGEVLGTGTGEPDQQVQLANTPVLPETVELFTLSDRQEPQRWYPINDLLAADPEVPKQDRRRPLYPPLYPVLAPTQGQDETRLNVFTLDPESGVIRFGDGAHGRRPTQGVRIIANYAFGGGSQGNVGIGVINRSPQLPAGYTVTNPLRTWGGDDAQDVTAAEKSIPRQLQHRDRLVSVQDFKDIAQQTPGVDLARGRVEVLPLFDPTQPTAGQIPGVVTVMVVPYNAAYNAAPKPDQFLLETVCQHLQIRRLITTELHVRGPEYINIWVSVGIDLVGGYAAGPVRDAVRQALFQFLSPLRGGYPLPGERQGTGWPLETAVRPQDLKAVVARVDGVRSVGELSLGTTTQNTVTSVPITGLALPRLVDVGVEVGQAIPLSNLRNAPKPTSVTPEEGQTWTPIPVLPERC
jgi:hypothetical protein